jgi:hypothetical protein
LGQTSLCHPKWARRFDAVEKNALRREGKEEKKTDGNVERWKTILWETKQS